MVRTAAVKTRRQRTVSYEREEGSSGHGSVSQTEHCQVAILRSPW